MKKDIYLLLGAVIMISLLFTGCGVSQETGSATDDGNAASQSEAPVSLLVYAGAGLKMPMEEIKTAFEAENNVTIEYVYAGSAQLLSQMESSGKGDAFIVGSEDTYKKAMDKGLANEYHLIAHHTPAIMVAKGNPLNIQTLDDLAKEGVKVVLGDPKSNAIGATAQKLIEKNSLQDINTNVVAQTATINEIVTAITAGNADAGIVTADSAYGNDDVELIAIPEAQNIDQLIPIGSLTIAANPDMAAKFVEFVASDAGKAIFEKYEFSSVKE